MNAFLRFLTKPFGIYVVSTLLSFNAWWVPLSGGLFVKGYSVRKPFFTVDLIYVLVWTVGIICFSYIGFVLGRRYGKLFSFARKIHSGDDIFANLGPYHMLSALGILGTVVTFYQVVGTAGLRLIIYEFLIGTGNVLNNTLYSDYHVGIVSLRYLTILSGALGAYKATIKKVSPLDIINIIFVFLNVAISARLCFIIFSIIYLAYVVIGGRVKFRTDRILLGVLVVFTVLTAANYARNAAYYRQFGITNPITMNIAQVDAYLGTPFQGELATAETPTLRSGNDLSFDQQVGITDIAYNFNTNSAMNVLLNLMGNYGYVVMFGTTLISSFAMGSLFRLSGTYIFTAYGTLLYCYSDLFRLFMFNQGIIITILLGSVLASVWPARIRIRI